MTWIFKICCAENIERHPSHRPYVYMCVCVNLNRIFGCCWSYLHNFCLSQNIKSTKSTISDGDCKDIDDFPVQTQIKKKREKNKVNVCALNTHITATTIRHRQSKKKNGMKIFARNQYKEWISLYRSYKKNGGVCLNSNVTFRPNHQHSELKEPVIVVGELWWPFHFLFSAKCSRSPCSWSWVFGVPFFSFLGRRPSINFQLHFQCAGSEL